VLYFFPYFDKANLGLATQDLLHFAWLNTVLGNALIYDFLKPDYSFDAHWEA
jgi:hypothetical protein